MEGTKHIEDFKKMGFNEAQLYEISLGLNDGVDVDLYAKKDISAAEMFEIRECLTKEIKEYEAFLEKEKNNQGNIEEALLMMEEERSRIETAKIGKVLFYLELIFVLILVASIIISYA